MNRWPFLRRFPGDYRFAAIEVILESISQFCAQRGRRFLQGVSEAREEVVELLVRPIEHIASEQTAARAEFEDFDFRRPVERLPHLVKLSREQASEDGVNVARGIEVSGFAELFCIARIVTGSGIVKADLHVARKRHRAAVADFLLDLFADGHSGRGARRGKPRLHG